MIRDPPFRILEELCDFIHSPYIASNSKGLTCPFEHNPSLSHDIVKKKCPLHIESCRSADSHKRLNHRTRLRGCLPPFDLHWIKSELVSHFKHLAHRSPLNGLLA